jgi:hypothetical protein
VDISLLEEARDTLSYWHFGFHVINRPQSGRRLKDFIRLGGIGFDYRATRNEREALKRWYRLLQAKHRAATI